MLIESQVAGKILDATLESVLWLSDLSHCSHSQSKQRSVLQQKKKGWAVGGVLPSAVTKKEFDTTRYNQKTKGRGGGFLRTHNFEYCTKTMQTCS
jgi:hypothetical protein